MLDISPDQLILPTVISLITRGGMRQFAQTLHLQTNVILRDTKSGPHVDGVTDHHCNVRGTWVKL
jgi:hypothetical protein